jgi:hypothetical protein
MKWRPIKKARKQEKGGIQVLSRAWEPIHLPAFCSDSFLCLKPMIECEGHKRFGTFTAVDHVSFPSGKVDLRLSRPERLRKTTLIRMLRHSEPAMGRREWRPRHCAIWSLSRK